MLVPRAEPPHHTHGGAEHRDSAAASPGPARALENAHCLTWECWSRSSEQGLTPGTPKTAGTLSPTPHKDQREAAPPLITCCPVGHLARETYFLSQQHLSTASLSLPGDLASLPKCHQSLISTLTFYSRYNFSFTKSPQPGWKPQVQESQRNSSCYK